MLIRMMAHPQHRQRDDDDDDDDDDGGGDDDDDDDDGDDYAAPAFLCGLLATSNLRFIATLAAHLSFCQEGVGGCAKNMCT